MKDDYIDWALVRKRIDGSCTAEEGERLERWMRGDKERRRFVEHAFRYYEREVPVVDGALQEAVNREMEVVSLLDVLGDAARLEELTEGMQADHDHDGHDHSGAEYDEHIWLSLQNAELLTGAIADAFGRMDPAHAADFAANAAAYTEQLDALDGQYRAAVEASPVRTVLFGDRFPFRYLVEDYGLDYYAAFPGGLDYYAAFPGCSAETEASFETVAFLAGKTAELDLPAVLAIENSGTTGWPKPSPRTPATARRC